MPNITKSFVRAAKCEEGKSKQEYYDNELKGYMLEVKANNRKTFYLRITTKENKRQSIKIADATLLDADTARTKALKLKRSIEEGKDVIIDTPESTVKTITLEEFYTEYYLPYVQKHIKSFEANRSLFKNHILPTIGNTPMNEIKKLQVMKLHSEMVHKKRLSPATANKTLIFISHAYNLAKELELEAIEENPASGVKHFEENNARERYLTKKEAKKLLIAVHESENTHLKYIIQMLILTGARRGEVLKARWRDFDEVQLTWTIPTSKNGKKRILPLTPKLYELYKSLPKESNTYLFISPKTKKPYTSIFSSWNRARTKAGLADLRLHDLRHSYASALVNSGRSLYEVQTLLGHSTASMTQRYSHLSNESLMNAASCAGKLVG